MLENVYNLSISSDNNFCPLTFMSPDLEYHYKRNTVILLELNSILL